MNREIKFRAWDNNKKEMFQLLNNPISELSQATLPIMQYTGLKDKNGKEIYEGDIVKLETKDNVFIEIENSENGVYKTPETMNSVVEFLDGAFIFNGMFGYEGQEIGFEQIEVIGNKYEHPELLKSN